MSEVKQRLKQALRSEMSNDPGLPDQATSLTHLIRALREDSGRTLALDKRSTPQVWLRRID